MKYLVVSDMHGNWDAFRAVLREVRRKSFGATLVLGDLVGYGAAPNQVVEALSDLPGTVYRVRGNHDKAVAEIDDGSQFNRVALEAARWTTGKLTTRNLATVRDLPEGPRAVADGLAICHGSPVDEDLYLFNDHDALMVFAAWPVSVTFFGHTHVTSMFSLADQRLSVRALRGETGRLELDPDGRYLLNPGSVGQPRDGDPRASYMIYDSDRSVVRWYRIEYPVERAQERILRAGLPPVLAERLARGL